MTVPLDLARLGFLPDDVAGFQTAWNLGTALTVDGIAGPLTRAALAASIRRRGAGLGDLSAHFSAREFACRCGGVLPGCRRVRITRAQLAALETYRATAGPVSPVSGYRCPEHNTRAGGVSNSQHLYGAATDVPAVRTIAQVKALRVFSGIGFQRSTGRVVHVDTRHASGRNTTGGTPAAPTVWEYA